MARGNWFTVGKSWRGANCRSGRSGRLSSPRRASPKETRRRRQNIRGGGWEGLWEKSIGRPSKSRAVRSALGARRRIPVGLRYAPASLHPPPCAQRKNKDKDCQERDILS